MIETPSNNDRLAAALALDVGIMDSAYHKARGQAVRDRFLAGMVEALDRHAPEGLLWLDVAAESSTHWVRAAITPQEHDRLLKDPSAKNLKAFFRSLGTTRAAISSTSRDTRRCMGLNFPVWSGAGRPMDRQELRSVCLPLLNHPELVLSSQCLAQILFERLESTLEPPAQDRTALRL